MPPVGSLRQSPSRTPPNQTEALRAAEGTRSTGLPRVYRGDRLAEHFWVIGVRPAPRTLSDLSSPVLRIACARCGRSGRYSVARLWREHGDLKLTDFLAELTADCRRKGPAIYDRCDGRFEF